MIRSWHLVAFLAALLAASVTPAQTDPPGRVGRISLVSGTVTLRNDYFGESETAVLNRPVTGGNVLVTGPGSRAEVHIGSTSLRLDANTELEISKLDDQQSRLRLLRGTAAARVRSRDNAEQFELYTPQGRVSLNDVGAYRFDVGHPADTTALVAYHGSAQFSGSGGEMLTVRAGQRAEIWGGEPLNYSVGSETRDDFDSWSLARDRREDESRSARYVSREMTGYEALDDNGYWRQSADYGPVWYPAAVPAGWAPYRWGHWEWIPPWGWTWIDDMPWGFAPFHYGRWVTIRGVWAWVPGAIVARPVYAPALVVWVGQPGWSVSFSSGPAAAVGWFPLGPHEVFVPAYHHSPRYVTRINETHVTNVKTITNIVNAQSNVSHVRYVNRNAPNALTVVPAQVMTSRAKVARSIAPIKDPPPAIASQRPSFTPPVGAPRIAGARHGGNAPAALPAPAPARGAAPPRPPRRRPPHRPPVRPSPSPAQQRPARTRTNPVPPRLRRRAGRRTPTNRNASRCCARVSAGRR